MQDSSTAHSLTTIHFPQRINLIKKLRYVSFLVNDIVLVGSVIVFIASVTNIPAVKDFLFQKLSINQFSSILFIITGVPLLFGAIRHISDSNELNKIHYFRWNTLLPLIFALVTAILGAISIVRLNLPPIAGLCFFLLGVSLIPPFTRIPHRFHITQLLVFIVSGLSMYVVLVNIFQILSPSMLHVTFFTFSLGLTFAFFCFGILLRWSNRGFFGNFTLDSTGSRFAFRIFLINLFTVPLITLIVLVAFHNKSYGIDELLSILVVLFAFISSLLIWINAKLLYPYELEHLLMRESLRSHNIDLTKEEENLRQKMTEIEQEKQEYKSELNIQSGWRNAIEGIELEK